MFISACTIKRYNVFIICDILLTWIWGSIFLTSSIYKTIETRLGLEQFEIDSSLNWPLSDEQHEEVFSHCLSFEVLEAIMLHLKCN